MFFALLFNLQHLPRERAVCLCHFPVRIVGVDALAFGADLRRPDRAWNLRVEDLNPAAVGGAKQGADLLGVVRAVICHREQDAVDPKVPVDLTAHLVHRLQELFKTLGREKLRLRRDENTVRRGERVYGDHPQRGHTVDENIVIVPFHGLQHLPEYLFTGHRIDEGDLRPGKFDVGRKEIDVLGVVKDAFTGLNLLIFDNTAHGRRQGKGQLVRLREAEGDRERTLRV